MNTYQTCNYFFKSIEREILDSDLMRSIFSDMGCYDCNGFNHSCSVYKITKEYDKTKSISSLKERLEDFHEK